MTTNNAIKDSRMGGVSQPTESGADITLVGDSDSDGISMDITRRDALIGAFAGTLGYFGMAEQAEAQTENIDYQVNDVAALIANGEPNRFLLGDSESLGGQTDGGDAGITIGWDGLRENQQINVRGQIAPEGGDFETLSIRSVRVQESSGTITLSPSEVFCDSGDVEVTEHSQISLDDLTIDDPEEQDIIQQNYVARIDIETLDGAINERVEDTFTVSIGYQYGFGVEFGLNFGVPDPEGWDSVAN